RWPRDWSSDVCSSDLGNAQVLVERHVEIDAHHGALAGEIVGIEGVHEGELMLGSAQNYHQSHIQYLFCLKPNGRHYKDQIVLYRSEERRVGKECLWRV